MAAQNAKERSSGRYDITRADRMVPGGRARINARSRTISPVEAAVDDPYGGKDRILVTVNRRVDLLEMERSHGRITESAYRTGQILQDVFQRMGYASIGAANIEGSSRSDPAMARDAKVYRMVETAQQVQAMMNRVARHLGMIDTRVLRRLLGDRMSFQQCAAFEGKTGERGERYVALRFRDALEELAKAWSSKGGRADQDDDKYSAMAKSRHQDVLDRSGKT